MSGAPVFDNNGIVIGILTSGVDDQKGAYSIVSSIAPVLDHVITHSWRPGPKVEGLLVRDLLEQLKEAQ